MMADTSNTNLHPRQSFTTIPTDTIKTARSILGRENLYMKVGDNWNTLLANVRQGDSDNGSGAGACRTPIMAVATVLQYRERLSDRQVEEASRIRVDWKYALHLSMHHPGLSRLMLCEYRQHVFHQPAWRGEFQNVLDRFYIQGLINESQHGMLKATNLVDEVCSQSRLEEVMLAQREALEALATNYPKWLRNIILPHWYSRYHLFKARPDLPHTISEQAVMSEKIGDDIYYLFEAIGRTDQPELGEMEEIKRLRQTWLEQFELGEDGTVHRRPRCSFCGTMKVGSEMGG